MIYYSTIFYNLKLVGMKCDGALTLNSTFKIACRYSEQIFGKL